MSAMDPRIRLRPLLLGPLVLALSAAAFAQAPPGYYDSVDTSSPAAMRATLHEVIDDHLRFPYTSGNTDTWDILEEAQENPSNSAHVIDVYLNASYVKHGQGNSDYDREHPWPKSYGFPNDNSSNYPYSDCHVLFLCNGSYNSSRGNKPFGSCTASCTEKPTVANNGEGGGSGVYPGNSNWASTSYWEAWGGKRGDVARALLYMDVRYEGGLHGVTSAQEPDLILTDDPVLIANSNTGQNELVAYMGLLSVLLQWHYEDPPDDFERDGHEVVYGYQGNRNPFIDHPEWVDCIFLGTCIGSEPIPYCFGDGSGTACPCGNAGGSGRGCANSEVSSGCFLTSLGSTSLAADDFSLVAGESIASAPGLFFGGTTRVNGGLGIHFGEGLRCAGGMVTRLEVDVAGFLGDASTSESVTAGQGILPGETRTYQWWYRDTSALPCGGTFNTSNGLEVTWGP